MRKNVDQQFTFKSFAHYIMNNVTVNSMLFQDLQPIPMVNVQKCNKMIAKRQQVCYTDTAIINGIKVRDVGVINYLYYKFYKQIGFMVITNSGTKMDAEDLFQEALIVIYQKFSKGSLELISSFYTYLYSICWHIWLQQLRKRNLELQYHGISDLNTWEDDKIMKDFIDESEKFQLFQDHFLRLSQPEQKVLRLYLNKTPSNEVAILMGYKSGNYAKFRKFICKEKLKNSIMNDPKYKKLMVS